MNIIPLFLKAPLFMTDINEFLKNGTHFIHPNREHQQLLMNFFWSVLL